MLAWLILAKLAQSGRHQHGIEEVPGSIAYFVHLSPTFHCQHFQPCIILKNSIVDLIETDKSKQHLNQAFKLRVGNQTVLLFEVCQKL